MARTGQYRHYRRWRVTVYRWVIALLLGGCATSPAMAPDLDLVDRFDLVAFRADDRSVHHRLWRWDRVISVHYVGPEAYRQDVYDHANRLGELTGKAVIVEGDYANMIVEISERDTGATCKFVTHTRDPADIHIQSALSPAYIRQCILQEMTQALGLIGDLDGMFGSRGDSVFASHQTADHLTEQDIALIRILYDRRLHHGMPRYEALPIVRQIVAEMEAEQQAAR